MSQRRFRIARPLLALAVFGALLPAGCAPKPAAVPKPRPPAPRATTVSTSTALALATEAAVLAQCDKLDRGEFRGRVTSLTAGAASAKADSTVTASALEDIALAARYEQAALSAWDDFIADKRSEGADTAEWLKRFPQLGEYLDSSATRVSFGDLLYALLNIGQLNASSALDHLGAAYPESLVPHVIRPVAGTPLYERILAEAARGLGTTPRLAVHQLYVEDCYALGDVQAMPNGGRTVVVLRKRAGNWHLIWSDDLQVAKESDFYGLIRGDVVNLGDLMVAFSVDGHEGPDGDVVRAMLKPLEANLASTLATPVALQPLTVYARDEWAYVYAVATRPDGAELAWRKTESEAEDTESSSRVNALVRNQGGDRWEVVRFERGAHEGVWMGWMALDDVPKEIFPISSEQYDEWRTQDQ